MTGRLPRPGPFHRLPIRLLATRICVVLAAVCLVVTVTVVALGPPGLPLSAGLLLLDPGSVPTLQRLVLDHLPGAAWTGLVLPFLRRPAWLPTMMATILASGLAISLGRRS